MYMKFEVHFRLVEQVKWVLIKLYCLNKIVPKSEKPEIYSLLIVDCALNSPVPAHYSKECCNTGLYYEYFIEMCTT